MMKNKSKETKINDKKENNGSAMKLVGSFVIGAASATLIAYYLNSRSNKDEENEQE
jgi:hypothetical protein